MRKFFDFIGNGVDKVIYTFLYFMDYYFWVIFAILLLVLGVFTLITP